VRHRPPDAAVSSRTPLRREYTPPYSHVNRKYPEAKLQENLDSEIMEVLLAEAREAFAAEIVVELTSNTSDEMEANVGRVETWLTQWKENNPASS
jgi:broad-specificity NMP kinase